MPWTGEKSNKAKVRFCSITYKKYDYNLDSDQLYTFVVKMCTAWTSQMLYGVAEIKNKYCKVVKKLANN